MKISSTDAKFRLKALLAKAKAKKRDTMQNPSIGSKRKMNFFLEFLSAASLQHENESAIDLLSTTTFCVLDVYEVDERDDGGPSRVCRQRNFHQQHMFPAECLIAALRGATFDQRPRPRGRGDAEQHH